MELGGRKLIYISQNCFPRSFRSVEICQSLSNFLIIEALLVSQVVCGGEEIDLDQQNLQINLHENTLIRL